MNGRKEETKMHDETMPRLPLNQARWDRQLRFALAIGLFALGLSGLFGETLSATLRIAALVPFATAVLGWCPAYDALGFSTRKEADGHIGTAGLHQNRAA
jgi:hypothetical protein